MRKRKRGSSDAERPEAHRSRITPTDIQQKEFRLAFRGYNERDVDEFLDRLTEDLASYVDETRRLRERLSAGGTAPNAEEGSRQAEALLAEAREEAARIVREAEERAAVVGAGTGTVDARGIIGPFLNRERDFLQSLGRLVQAHAETIRGMVLAYREQAEPSVLAQPSPADPARSGEPEEPPPSTAAVPGREEPVVVSDEAAAPPERQRSLRELFWGED